MWRKPRHHAGKIRSIWAILWFNDWVSSSNFFQLGVHAYGVQKVLLASHKTFQKLELTVTVFCMMDHCTASNKLVVCTTQLLPHTAYYPSQRAYAHIVCLFFKNVQLVSLLFYPFSTSARMGERDSRICVHLQFLWRHNLCSLRIRKSKVNSS